MLDIKCLAALFLVPKYMADTTTRTQISNAINNFYNRTLLERAVPLYLHTRFGQVRDIPMKSGTDTIKWRKYGALTATTTALTDGVTPSGSQLSITDTTAQIQYYGDYVTFSDKVKLETIDPLLTETADVLGEQAGDSIDQICRTVLVAGTTVQYAATATATNEVTAAMKLTRDEVKQAVRTLQGNNARPVTAMVNAGANVNTMPINRAYIGIISEDTLYDLDDATGWIPVEKYPNKRDVMPGEVGSLAGVRFLMTTNAGTSAAGGADSNDVHYTLILGKNAYGVTRLAGNAMRNIIKPLGSAGSGDPLDQRSTSGWKATFVAKILQQAFMIRVEHGVSA